MTSHLLFVAGKRVVFRKLETLAAAAHDVFAIIDKLPPERFRIFSSLRFAHLLELMNKQRAMVSKSSVAVCEAPLVGRPSRDVIKRQSNCASVGFLRAVDTNVQCAIVPFLDAHWGQRNDRYIGFDLLDHKESFQDVV
jgi:UDP-N-acetylglucosamine 2-epimerase (hydrolysing)